MNNVIIFDLDETLGYFTELGIFWQTIVYLLDNKIKEDEFFNVMDLYPEFLRPNIFNILEYIKIKKIKKECDLVVIYTNNQGPNKWYKLITYYFNYKLKYKLFDKIIGPYTPENCRSSTTKKYKDVTNCLNLQPTTNICFIDNQIHNQMINKMVYYLHINTFVNCLPYEYMALTFYNTYKHLINISKINFIKITSAYMTNYNHKLVIKKEIEIQDDKKISSMILKHIKLFFKDV